MTPGTYNTLTDILLGSALISAVLAVAFLVAAVIGWNGPHRKTRLYQFVGFLVLSPALVGAQQFLLWGIFMPSLKQAGEEEMLARRQERFDRSTHVSIGDKVPEFELIDIDGNHFSTNGSAEKNKVVLINFFATWCGPCLSELPHMQKIWERHGKNENFSMIVIGREESLQTVREFRSEQAYTFPFAADPDRQVFSLFAKESIPRIFLISSEGKVLYATLGYDTTELERLDQLLADML